MAWQVWIRYGRTV